VIESLIMRVNCGSYSGGPLYCLEHKVEQVYMLINTSFLLLVVLAVMYRPWFCLEMVTDG